MLVELYGYMGELVSLEQVINEKFNIKIKVKCDEDKTEIKEFKDIDIADLKIRNCMANESNLERIRNKEEEERFYYKRLIEKLLKAQGVEISLDF